MRKSKSLTGIVLCAALTACAAMPANRTADVVPPELVPAGFEAKDCHFEPVAPHDSGGLSSMDSSGGGVAAVAAADHGGGVRGQVKCHRTTQLLPETTQCLDDNGQEHPLQWCKDRQAARDGATAGKPSS